MRQLVTFLWSGRQTLPGDTTQTFATLWGASSPSPPSQLHFANVLNVQIKFKMSSLQRPRQRKLSSSRETATTATPTSTAARVVLELEMKVKIRRLRRQLRC